MNPALAEMGRQMDNKCVGAAAFTVSTPADMERLGFLLGSHLSPDEFVCLMGPLGAGKTTLVRGLARGLGVTDPVASPTYVIARRQSGARADLLHCDVYRLGSVDEIIDLDLDTVGAVTILEWGAAYISALTDDYLMVTIERTVGSGVDDREVVLRGAGADWPRRRIEQITGAFSTVSSDRTAQAP
jgi:tRNA threonylcarbamoyladenosine biosynthesis protein TsaE